MSNTIVCGVDRSDGADRAASVAARLAEGMGYQTELVHVQPSPSLFQRLVWPTEPGKRRLRAVASKHRFPDGAHTHLRTGDPVDELMRLAEEHDSALIVVGSRGLSELGSALLGSVSSALMARSPCPVVVVPRETTVPLDPADLRSAVCGVAGARRDGQVLRLGADLVNRLGGSLHAVHAFDAHEPAGPGPPHPAPLSELWEAAEDTLAHALVDAGVKARGHVVDLPPAAALGQVARDEGAGLIVVGSQGLGKLGSVLLGSVTIQLAAEARGPVVVLPPDAQVAAGSGHYEVAASPN